MMQNGEMVKVAETNALHITKQWEVAAVKLELELVIPGRIADFIRVGSSLTAFPKLKQYSALVISVPHYNFLL